MKIEKQFTIDAEARDVWQVLGPQYDQVGLWASSVHRSEKHSVGTKPPQAPCSGRVCTTELGPFRESILEYDEERKILAYDAQGEKMPFFVKNMINRWQLRPAASGTTEVEMELSVDMLPGFGLLMGPMMKRKLGKVLGHVAEELDHYVTRGEPHPRKAASRPQH